MINQFLKELRESADIQYSIFTNGSCFRLYKILKIVFPEVEAYWSDMDRHCIVNYKGEFYDIGGIMSKTYVKSKSYYKIDKSQLRGFSLLKYINNDECLGAKVEKYKN